jgi:DHA2 family multidrug resistance protein-like MFS transporter
VPADVAVALLASARDAFTAGLNLAGAVGAGLFVVMAAVALVVLRDRGHTSAAGDATVERDAAV